VALVIGFAVAGRAYRRKVARLAGLSFVAYLGGVGLAYPYLRYALKHYPTSLTRSEAHFSLDLSGLVFPRTDRTWGPSWLHAAVGHDIQATTYLGIPLLLIFIWLAVVTWSSRLTRLLVIAFLVIIALACGASLTVAGDQLFSLPWSGLWNLPIARSAEPVRLILFAYLLLSVALALWIARLATTRRRLPARLGLAKHSGLVARTGLAALALAAIFADLPTFAEVVVPPPPNYQPANTTLQEQTELPSFISKGIYKNYISQGEIVVVLSHRGNAAMMFQAATDFYFRIAGGFINASLSRPDALPYPVALMSHITKIRAIEFEQYMQHKGIGAIIVEHSWSGKWMYFPRELGIKGTNIGGVTVYQFNQVRSNG
jgi:hypothetical protein